MRYRLLALDLDGTVLGPDMVIPPSVREAVRAFQERGGRVTVATGRMVRTTVPFAEALGVDGPLICYQGAVIQDHRTDQRLFHEPVPSALAAEAVRKLLNDGVYVHAYINDELFVPWDKQELAFYLTFSDQQVPVYVVDDLAALVAEQPPTKLLFVDDEDRVGPRVAGLQMHFTERLQVVRSHARFGELNAPGCTKGRALAELASKLGIAQEQVAAAGDHFNDIEMVAWAGLGMAVRSGPAELHAVANVLIDEPGHGGLATGIRRYLLDDAVSREAP